MDRLKKGFRFLGSMQFAMILLGILIAACAVGSVITQGKPYSWYSEVYGGRIAGLIMALQLDDSFHSWWFILITAFLCLNLLLCNLLRLPSLIRRFQKSGKAESVSGRTGSLSVDGIESPEKIFEAMRFRKIKEESDAGENRILFSTRGRIGIWGAWVCHFGVLVLILGFALGQSLKKEYSVYGVPGQTREIGDTDYLLTIDDFRIGLREDDTVEQYTADLTVRRASDGAEEAGSASVNHPASMFGMRFYQNSTGWAARITVEKDGEELQSEVLCAGEFAAVSDKPDLVVYLNAFYPDYALVEGNPVTLSSELNNPAYLYTVYYQGNIIGMNALTGDDVITIDDYTVSFSNPQTYTLIQIKRDRFTPLAFAGGIITLAGLFLALFVWPGTMWAVQNPDGLWTVYAESRKGGQLFADIFSEASEKGKKDDGIEFTEP